MKKVKYLFFLLVVVVCIFVIWNKKKSNSVTNKIIENKIDNTPISLQVGGEAKNVDAKIEKKLVKKENAVHDEKFDEYEAEEKLWILKAKKIFTDKEFLTYQDLRMVNEKEKEKAYQDYHDYLRAKFGSNFKYNISEDQSINEKKINQRYLKELLKVVGERKFNEYIKLRDSHNEEMLRKTNGKNSIVIEF